MVNSVHNFFRQMFVWVVKMLEYNKIDVSEVIDIDKTKCVKRMYALSLLVFKDIGTKFESNVYNNAMMHWWLFMN